MAIGNSLGAFHEDDFRHAAHPWFLDPETIKPGDTGDDMALPPDEGSYDNKAKVLEVSNHSGFRMSDNITDLRNEFFDERTDKNNDLPPGGWLDKENNVSIEPTLLSRAAGSTDLDLARVKQIDAQIEVDDNPFEQSVIPPNGKTDEEVRNSVK